MSASAPPPEQPAPPRRPGPTMRTRVTEHTPEGSRRVEDRLATEEPLEVRLAWPGSAAQRVWVTMRTPGHDFELAVGVLVHEGLLSPGSLHRVAYCTDQELTAEEELNVVTVTRHTPPPRPVTTPDTRVLGSGSSACGVCGSESIAAALATGSSAAWRPSPAPAVGAADPDPALVRTLPAQLREHQQAFDRTGGLHAAGLFDEHGTALVVREDVGRHNAVDKVTGARVLTGDRPDATTLVVSGRAGFELVQKAVTVGVGAFVAVGAPSSLARELAARSGLALFGFTSARRTVRYC